MLQLIFIFTFISTAVLVYLIYSYYSSRKKIINRMQHYLNPEKSNEKIDKDNGINWREGFSTVGKAVRKSSIGNKYMADLENLLLQAHVMLKVEEFITIEIICSLLFMALGLILFPVKILIIPMALLGFILPTGIVKLEKRKILKKVDEQLPDTIMLLSNSIKAGYSFLQAVEVASKELPAPISIEFKRLSKEVNLGVNTETALESISERVESEDVKLLIIAVLIQRQTGGNLSEVLDNISETIRSRVKIKGEINVLTAQGRISGTIVCLLPIVLVAAMNVINPEYIKLLFTDPMGKAMLVFAVFMQVMGILSINKIIKIEV